MNKEEEQKTQSRGEALGDGTKQKTPTAMEEPAGSGPTYQEIAVLYGDNESKEATGHQRLIAEVLGPFGIHPAYRLSGYTVTHLNTGFVVTSQWPSIEAARQIARDILSLGLDWSFTDPFTVMRSESHEPVRQLLRQRRAERDAALARAEGRQP